MTIPESVRALIATGPPAYLTTLNADGSPQVTLVWVGTENDEIVIPHMKVWQKVKNMRRDPRVALAILGLGKSPRGYRSITFWSYRSIWWSTARPGLPKEERRP